MAVAQSRPWYREGMVWMLIGIPASSVLMGIVMITLALKSDDGLVVDDYYKKGLEINQVLERDRRASELGLHAELAFEPGDNRLSMTLTGNSSLTAPEQVQVGLFHATRQHEDRVVVLRRDSQGLYTAPLPELVPGRWHLGVETEDWRLTRTITLPVDSSVRIFPNS